MLDTDTGQPIRPDSGVAGLAQLPRDKTDLGKVVSGAAELRASERRETQAGCGSEPVSLVLG